MRAASDNLTSAVTIIPWVVLVEPLALQRDVSAG